MQYKILESLGVEIENTDDAAFNNFLVSGESGIVKGVLDECKLVDLFGTIAITTGELLIQGFRIKITEAYKYTPVGTAASRTNYHIIGRLELHAGGEVSFNIITRTISELRQDDLHKLSSGIHEVELARFVHYENSITSLTKSVGFLSLSPIIKPEFAESIEELNQSGDTTKMYVLPDGYIYAYMYAEVAVGGYTNQVDIESADFKPNQRYNASGAITSSSIETANSFVSNMFPIKSGDVLRIKGVRASTSTNATAPVFVAARLKADGGNVLSTGNASNMYLGEPLGADVSVAQQCWNAFTTLDDGTIEWIYAINNAGDDRAINSGNFLGEIAYTRIAGVATNGFENVIVTVNAEIIEPTIEKKYAWTNTGHAFVPADYEPRIIALEKADTQIREEITSAKAETDTAIADLQEQINSGAASAKSGARWFALGDSITEGWTSAVDASASSGYKQFLNTNAAQRWVNIVAEKNGYELTNYGIGGTGYLQGATHNARLLVDGQAVNSNGVAYPTPDFTQCDFVTLAYGVNDWKYAVNIGSMEDNIETGGSMVANMRYVIKKILTVNPLCKIFVITPINCRSYGSYDTNWGINYKGGTTGALNGLGLQDIFDRMKEVCDYHGVELIDMTHSSIINRENIKTMLADYVHPTVECYAVMARELARKINFI